MDSPSFEGRAQSNGNNSTDISYQRNSQAKAENPQLRRLVHTRRLARKASFTNKNQSDGIEKTASEPPRPQASVTTYDSRLLVGDSALLVPISSRASSLRVEMIQESDSEDFKLQGSGLAKRTQSKDYKFGSVKRMKKERPAVKTKHVQGFLKNPNLPAVTEEALLVPIRLEIDLGEYRLKDTFLWNLHETLITPSKFAEILCSDLNLPTAQYQTMIEDSIIEQLNRFQEIHLQISSSSSIFQEKEQDHDIKVSIELDFLLGRYHFKDAFEWDPSSDTTPEEFATILAADLGLGGEFVAVISHSIREQLLKFSEQKLEVLPYLRHRDRSSSSMKEIYRLLKSNSSKNSYLNMIIPNRGNNDSSTPQSFRDPKEIMEKGNAVQFCPTLKYLDDRELEIKLVKEETTTRTVRRRRDAPRRGERPRNSYMRSGTPTGSPAS
ncbi:Chromatin structure remodeling complex protein sfh1 [Entomophthora muscae]|uniref:Chromatin structure remodeling complex protein sfh1 n=2 Tax=Entomophthora muscae TaxID=34485 RepID=A0ACC2RIZ2_9FUNG|nr:Chromatin structure remodeling complex protein sfh1 [Entomophthora muscae]